MLRPIGTGAPLRRMWSRRRVLRTVSRLAGPCAMASIVTLGAPAVLGAQGEVDYGRGAYGQYRRDVARFAARSHDLVVRIAAIDVRATWCADAERAQAGRQLGEVRIAIGQLEREWLDFKARTRDLMQVPAVSAQFAAAGERPDSADFWSAADREIVVHPVADRDAKADVHAVSRVVDCTRQAPGTELSSDVQQAPPERLAGLARPSIPPADAPPVPPRFCSTLERVEWIADVVAQRTTALLDAAMALNRYQVALAPARDSARLRGDAGSERALAAAAAWAAARHAEVDARQWALVRLRDGASVGNCGGRSPADSGARRIQWRAGAGATYSRFPGFERNAFVEPGLLDVAGASDAFGVALSTAVQVRWIDIGVTAHRATLSLTQTYAPAPGRPRQVDGSVTSTSFDGSVGPRLRVGASSLWIFGGLGRVGSRFDYEAVDEIGVPSSGSRSRSGTTRHGGVALDIPARPSLDLRVGGTYTASGEADDADRNIRVTFGIVYRR